MGFAASSLEGKNMAHRKINMTLKQFNNIENLAIKSAKNKFYQQKITITKIYPVERLRKLPLLTNLDVW